MEGEVRGRRPGAASAAVGADVDVGADACRRQRAAALARRLASLENAQHRVQLRVRILETAATARRKPPPAVTKRREGEQEAAVTRRRQVTDETAPQVGCRLRTYESAKDFEEYRMSDREYALRKYPLAGTRISPHCTEHTNGEFCSEDDRVRCRERPQQTVRRLASKICLEEAEKRRYTEGEGIPFGTRIQQRKQLIGSKVSPHRSAHSIGKLCSVDDRTRNGVYSQQPGHPLATKTGLEEVKNVAMRRYMEWEGSTHKTCAEQRRPLMGSKISPHCKAYPNGELSSENDFIRCRKHSQQPDRRLTSKTSFDKVKSIEMLGYPERDDISGGKYFQQSKSLIGSKISPHSSVQSYEKLSSDDRVRSWEHPKQPRIRFATKTGIDEVKSMEMRQHAARRGNPDEKCTQLGTTLLGSKISSHCRAHDNKKLNSDDDRFRSREHSQQPGIGLATKTCCDEVKNMEMRQYTERIDIPDEKCTQQGKRLVDSKISPHCSVRIRECLQQLDRPLSIKTGLEEAEKNRYREGEDIPVEKCGQQWSPLMAKNIPPIGANLKREHDVELRSGGRSLQWEWSQQIGRSFEDKAGLENVNHAEMYRDTEETAMPGRNLLEHEESLMSEKILRPSCNEELISGDEHMQSWEGPQKRGRHLSTKTSSLHVNHDETSEDSEKGMSRPRSTQQLRPLVSSPRPMVATSSVECDQDKEVNLCVRKPISQVYLPMKVDTSPHTADISPKNSAKLGSGNPIRSPDQLQLPLTTKTVTLSVLGEECQNTSKYVEMRQQSEENDLPNRRPTQPVQSLLSSLTPQNADDATVQHFGGLSSEKDCTRDDEESHVSTVTLMNAKSPGRKYVEMRQSIGNGLADKKSIQQLGSLKRITSPLDGDNSEDTLGMKSSNLEWRQRLDQRLSSAAIMHSGLRQTNDAVMSDLKESGMRDGEFIKEMGTLLDTPVLQDVSGCSSQHKRLGSEEDRVRRENQSGEVIPTEATPKSGYVHVEYDQSLNLGDAFLQERNTPQFFREPDRKQDLISPSESYSEVELYSEDYCMRDLELRTQSGRLMTSDDYPDSVNDHKGSLSRESLMCNPDRLQSNRSLVIAKETDTEFLNVDVNPSSEVDHVRTNMSPQTRGRHLRSEYNVPVYSTEDSEADGLRCLKSTDHLSQLAATSLFSSIRANCDRSLEGFQSVKFTPNVDAMVSVTMSDGSPASTDFPKWKLIEQSNSTVTLASSRQLFPPIMEVPSDQSNPSVITTRSASVSNDYMTRSILSESVSSRVTQSSKSTIDSSNEVSTESQVRETVKGEFNGVCVQRSRTSLKATVLPPVLGNIDRTSVFSFSTPQLEDLENEYCELENHNDQFVHSQLTEASPIGRKAITDNSAKVPENIRSEMAEVTREISGCSQQGSQRCPVVEVHESCFGLPRNQSSMVRDQIQRTFSPTLQDDSSINLQSASAERLRSSEKQTHCSPSNVLWREISGRSKAKVPSELMKDISGGLMPESANRDETRNVLVYSLVKNGAKKPEKPNSGRSRNNAISATYGPSTSTAQSRVNSSSRPTTNPSKTARQLNLKKKEKKNVCAGSPCRRPRGAKIRNCRKSQSIPRRVSPLPSKPRNRSIYYPRNPFSHVSYAIDPWYLSRYMEFWRQSQAASFGYPPAGPSGTLYSGLAVPAPGVPMADASQTHPVPVATPPVSASLGAVPGGPAATQTSRDGTSARTSKYVRLGSPNQVTLRPYDHNAAATSPRKRTVAGRAPPTLAICSSKCKPPGSFPCSGMANIKPVAGIAPSSVASVSSVLAAQSVPSLSISATSATSQVAVSSSSLLNPSAWAELRVTFSKDMKSQFWALQSSSFDRPSRESFKEDLVSTTEAEKKDNVKGPSDSHKKMMESKRAEMERTETEKQERVRAERVKAKRERAQREKEERERAQREKEERERAQREKEERERAEREKAERERAEREKAERERAEREKAERESAESEKAEREIAEREKAERERAESEKAEREIAEREKAERERAEREKVERERAEREERERAQREERQRAEREERERAEREERERAQREEQERAAREEKERAEREERERAQREKAERERAEMEKEERERAEREKEERERAEREKAERERAETEKAERERAEREKAERERAEREERERAQMEKEARERAEREKEERERAQREKEERERAEREKEERERAEREKAERERAEREEERERAQREKEERERAQREKEERERAEREEAERERAQREKEERERAQREKEEIERAQREKEERERAQREKEQRERAEREEAERERAEREEAERERAEREEAERERAEREEKERERSEREKEERERAQMEKEKRERAERRRVKEERDERQRLETEETDGERAGEIDMTEKGSVEGKRAEIKESEREEAEKRELAEREREKRERVERERKERERAEREREEKERAERERKERDRAERERERIERERQERERIEREKEERERAERERERAEREREEKERAEMEREERERLKREREERERVEREREEKERAEREDAEKGRSKKETVEQEMRNVEKERIQREVLETKREKTNQDQANPGCAVVEEHIIIYRYGPSSSARSGLSPGPPHACTTSCGSCSQPGGFFQQPSLRYANAVCGCCGVSTPMCRATYVPPGWKPPIEKTASKCEVAEKQRVCRGREEAERAKAEKDRWCHGVRGSITHPMPWQTCESGERQEHNLPCTCTPCRLYRTPVRCHFPAIRPPKKIPLKSRAPGKKAVTPNRSSEVRQISVQYPIKQSPQLVQLKDPKRISLSQVRHGSGLSRVYEVLDGLINEVCTDNVSSKRRSRISRRSKSVRRSTLSLPRSSVEEQTSTATLNALTETSEDATDLSAWERSSSSKLLLGLASSKVTSPSLASSTRSAGLSTDKSVASEVVDEHVFTQDTASPDVSQTSRSGRSANSESSEPASTSKSVGESSQSDASSTEKSRDPSAGEEEERGPSDTQLISVDQTQQNVRYFQISIRQGCASPTFIDVSLPPQSVNINITEKTTGACQSSMDHMDILCANTATQSSLTEDGGKPAVKNALVGESTQFCISDPQLRSVCTSTSCVRGIPDTQSSDRQMKKDVRKLSVSSCNIGNKLQKYCSSVSCGSDHPLSCFVEERHEIDFADHQVCTPLCTCRIGRERTEHISRKGTNVPSSSSMEDSEEACTPLCTCRTGPERRTQIDPKGRKQRETNNAPAPVKQRVTEHTQEISHNIIRSSQGDEISHSKAMAYSFSGAPPTKVVTMDRSGRGVIDQRPSSFGGSPALFTDKPATAMSASVSQPAASRSSTSGRRRDPTNRNFHDTGTSIQGKSLYEVSESNDQPAPGINGHEFSLPEETSQRATRRPSSPIFFDFGVTAVANRPRKNGGPSVLITRDVENRGTSTLGKSLYESSESNVQPELGINDYEFFSLDETSNKVIMQPPSSVFEHFDPSAVTDEPTTRIGSSIPMTGNVEDRGIWNQGNSLYGVSRTNVKQGPEMTEHELFSLEEKTSYFQQESPNAESEFLSSQAKNGGPSTSSGRTASTSRNVKDTEISTQSPNDLPGSDVHEDKQGNFISSETTPANPHDTSNKQNDINTTMNQPNEDSARHMSQPAVTHLNKPTCGCRDPVAQSTDRSFVTSDFRGFRVPLSLSGGEGTICRRGNMPYLILKTPWSQPSSGPSVCAMGRGSRCSSPLFRKGKGVKFRGNASRPRCRIFAPEHVPTINVDTMDKNRNADSSRTFAPQQAKTIHVDRMAKNVNAGALSSSPPTEEKGINTENNALCDPKCPNNEEGGRVRQNTCAANNQPVPFSVSRESRRIRFARSNSPSSTLPNPLYLSQQFSRPGNELSLPLSTSREMGRIDYQDPVCFLGCCCTSRWPALNAGGCAATSTTDAQTSNLFGRPNQDGQCTTGVDPNTTSRNSCLFGRVNKDTQCGSSFAPSNPALDTCQARPSTRDKQCGTEYVPSNTPAQCSSYTQSSTGYTQYAIENAARIVSAQQSCYTRPISRDVQCGTESSHISLAPLSCASYQPIRDAQCGVECAAQSTSIERSSLSSQQTRSSQAGPGDISSITHEPDSNHSGHPTADANFGTESSTLTTPVEHANPSEHPPREDDSHAEVVTPTNANSQISPDTSAASPPPVTVMSTGTYESDRDWEKAVLRQESARLAQSGAVTPEPSGLSTHPSPTLRVITYDSKNFGPSSTRSVTLTPSATGTTMTTSGPSPSVRDAAYHAEGLGQTLSEQHGMLQAMREAVPTRTPTTQDPVRPCRRPNPQTSPTPGAGEVRAEHTPPEPASSTPSLSPSLASATQTLPAARNPHFVLGPPALPPGDRQLRWKPSPTRKPGGRPPPRGAWEGKVSKGCRCGAGSFHAARRSPAPRTKRPASPDSSGSGLYAAARCCTGILKHQHCENCVECDG